jgi:hypothetical protein
MSSNGLMQCLAQLIQREGSQKGFWQLFVKAQASTQGKYKGKGREGNFLVLYLGKNTSVKLQLR